MFKSDVCHLFVSSASRVVDHPICLTHRDTGSSEGDVVGKGEVGTSVPEQLERGLDDRRLTILVHLDLSMRRGSAWNRKSGFVAFTDRRSRYQMVG